jgi:hypothetical protein
MSFFADLSPCTYFGDEFTPYLRAVGWLSRDEPYTKGEVSELFFERLCQLLQNHWKMFQFLDTHECEFCRFTGGYGDVFFQGKYKIKATSSTNILIPGKGFIYVAPDSIAHYIDAHEYCPPEDFCQAVLECPDMETNAYVKAMLRNGGKDWRRVAIKPKFKYRLRRRV